MVYLGNLISKNVKNRNKNILDVSHDIASSEKWCQCLDKKVQDFRNLLSNVTHLKLKMRSNVVRPFLVLSSCRASKQIEIFLLKLFFLPGSLLKRDLAHSIPKVEFRWLFLEGDINMC
jgi:hypothetical protein